MNSHQIRQALNAEVRSKSLAFDILRSIAAMLADEEQSVEAQSLLIRALEHRDDFSPFTPLLNALLRETGLYPYAEPEELSFRDRVAFEFHRPSGQLGENGVVFHRVQAQVYWDLLDGQNVILSAPTSFGKSLIIDALIGSGKFDRIVLIVPTIALIDETRKRLTRFSKRYKIITHASQQQEQERGSIYVLTQERVIERTDLERVDFFVIDEFYKLDPAGGDRASVLNHAFYKLLKSAKQFYLLGPNIRAVPIDFKERFTAKLVVSDFATVATNVERVDIRGGAQPALVRLAQKLDAPTLIYCRSPGSVRKVAEALIEANVTSPASNLQDTVDWISRHFHPDWIVAKALSRGIGVHHGRLPRALAQLQVRLFNEGHLKFLICTSTLIEGVNTAAKHVVIYDNKISMKDFDYFTFKNIQGRSGRMFKHFVGTVHLFHEPPEPHLLDVDFPAFSQGDSATDGLLVQIDTSDLGREGRERVSKFTSQYHLSLETIKANHHIDPQQQIDLAKYIEKNISRLLPSLSWRGEPSNDQIYRICDLLFETLLISVSRDVVRSGRQLAFLIVQLRQLGSASAFIKARASLDEKISPTERIESALEFLRNWASFQFPRALIALERIQEEVLTRLGYFPGSYSSFAVRVENLMLPAALAALDEYGIPLQLVEAIRVRIPNTDNLDAVLAAVRKLDPLQLKLDIFETRLIKDVQTTL